MSSTFCESPPGAPRPRTAPPPCGARPERRTPRPWRRASSRWGHKPRAPPACTDFERPLRPINSVSTKISAMDGDQLFLLHSSLPDLLRQSTKGLWKKPLSRARSQTPLRRCCILPNTQATSSNGFLSVDHLSPSEGRLQSRLRMANGLNSPVGANPSDFPVGPIDGSRTLARKTSRPAQVSSWIWRNLLVNDLQNASEHTTDLGAANIRHS